MDIPEIVGNAFGIFLTDCVDNCTSYPTLYEKTLLNEKGVEIKVKVSLIEKCEKRVIDILEDYFEQVLKRYYEMIFDYPDTVFIFQLPVNYSDPSYSDLTWLEVECRLIYNS